MTSFTSRTTVLFVLCLTFCPTVALSSSKVVSRTFIPAKTVSSPRIRSLPAQIVSTKKNLNWMLKLRGGQMSVEDVVDTDISVENVVVTDIIVENVVATDVVVEDEVATEVNIEDKVATEEETVAVVTEEEIVEPVLEKKEEKNNDVPVMCSFLSPIAGVAKSFGAAYASSLNARPIITKSVTACFIFALSDYVAQRLELSAASSKENSSDISGKKKRSKQVTEQVTPSYNFIRTFTSAAVGLLYFGPAAHAWYDTIFKILPGTSLVSTLQKAALGQLLFGPSFTCVFFATSLLQAGEFSIGNWFRKIRNDLPGAWAAGLGFWPLVDLVSYSFIPSQWIPLFVNFCSFVWTIYLSMIANRSTKAE